MGKHSHIKTGPTKPERCPCFPAAMAQARSILASDLANNSGVVTTRKLRAGRMSGPTASDMSLSLKALGRCKLCTHLEVRIRVSSQGTVKSRHLLLRALRTLLVGGSPHA